MGTEVSKEVPFQEVGGAGMGFRGPVGLCCVLYLRLDGGYVGVFTFFKCIKVHVCNL